MIKHSTLLLLLFTLIVIPAQTQQRFDAPLYAQSGAYAVGTMELTIEHETRPLTVTVWYPAQETPGDEPDITYAVTPLFNLPGNAYRDADPFIDDAPYPLIVYSHGSYGARVVSLFLTEHLASQGFVVIAADHPGNNIEARVQNADFLAQNFALRPGDVIRQIDYAADVLNSENGFLEGLIDMDNVGVMGHSFGGWTALSVAGGRVDFDALGDFCDPLNNENGVCFVQDLAPEIASERGYETIPPSPWEAVTDSRIDAVLAMSPWNAPIMDVSEIAIPTFIIVGGDDSVTIPERDAFSFYERLNSPRSLMTFEFGEHYLFVDECAPLFIQFQLEELCTDPVWDMARAHDITNHAATAFFRANLMSDSDAALALDSENFEFPGVSYQQDN